MRPVPEGRRHGKTVADVGEAGAHLQDAEGREIGGVGAGEDAKKRPRSAGERLARGRRQSAIRSM